MSVIKCPRCGLQMGEGAFDNCPACNELLSVTVETPDPENTAEKLPGDEAAPNGEAEAQAETEGEETPTLAGADAAPVTPA